MDEVQWPAVSAVVAAVAAVIACASAMIALIAARTNVKLADFNNSLEVLKQISEAERKVATAANSPEQQAHEIRSLLNLFEVLALMINKKRIGKTARHLAENYLVEGWAWMQTTEGLAAIVEEATTGPSTFQQLGKFREKKNEEITSLVNRRRALSPTG